MGLGWKQKREIEDGREKREINWKNKKKAPRAHHHCNCGVSLDPGGLFPQKSASNPAQFLPQDDLFTNRHLHPSKSKRNLLNLPPLRIKLIFTPSCSSRILSWHLLILRNISLSFLAHGKHPQNPKRKLTNYSWETMRLQTP